MIYVHLAYYNGSFASTRGCIYSPPAEVSKPEVEVPLVEVRDVRFFFEFSTSLVDWGSKIE